MNFFSDGEPDKPFTSRWSTWVQEELDFLKRYLISFWVGYALLPTTQKMFHCVLIPLNSYAKIQSRSPAFFSSPEIHAHIFPESLFAFRYLNKA